LVKGRRKSGSSGNSGANPWMPGDLSLSSEPWHQYCLDPFIRAGQARGKGSWFCSSQ
jgi:hypothetical protein